MITNLPIVMIEGALTDDPEARFTGSGKCVTNVTLVTRERKRGSGGEWVDGDPTFVDVTVWGKFAENLVESCRKGDMVMAYGNIRQETWQARDGGNRSKLAMVAEAVGPSLRWNQAKTPRADGTYQGATGSPAVTQGATSSAVDDEPPF